MFLFLKIEDLLAPPPLSVLLAVLMVLGFKKLGSLITNRLSQAFAPALRQAAALIFGSALVATVVYILAIFGVAYLWLLRIMAWSLALLGLTELLHLKREGISEVFLHLRQRWEDLPPWGKVAMPPLLTAGICLFLTALSPPTDGDSLDYHLGVPLEILRHHGHFLRPDWLLPRITGIGESLNLLGLAGGTDIIGGALQFSGLVAATAGVMTLAKTDVDRILVAAAIIGCPVVMFLVPTQKPQMLPTAATTIAMLFLATRFRDMDAKTLILALSCVFFAISCKYSFMLTGGILVGLAFVAAHRLHLMGLTMGICLAAYLVLVFPVHWHNMNYYGDPISPLLERIKTVSDPTVLRLATQMRSYSDHTIFPFPLSILLPGSMGSLSTVLGLGPLLLFTGLKEARTNLVPKVLLSCAAVAVVCILAFSQLQGRFFFEPYLWVVAATAASAQTPGKRLLFKIMIGQLVVVALMAMFGAATLFPGSLTSAWRDRVMSRASDGYAETRWLNQVLPRDAVVLSRIKSSALMPRPFLSSNVFFYFDLTRPNELARFKALSVAAKVNTLLTEVPLPPVITSSLLPGLGEPLAGPKEFYHGVRNPWNRGEAYKIMVFRFNPQMLPTH